MTRVRACIASLTVISAAIAAAPIPTAAGRYFPPGAQVVSASSEKREQADDATTSVDISDDGRYVVFQTRARNLFDDSYADPPGQFRVGGIFRRDLQTGALALVAGGSLYEDSTPDTIAVRGAANPSVSADGRFVAFSTAEPLVPADTNDNVDVYVRDMARLASSPTAYVLASAIDGSASGITWAAPLVVTPGRNPGAEISPGGGISADGNRVVFRTQETGNAPAGGVASVAAGQVLVRELSSERTTLVTRNKDSGAPAGGALSAAVISADGSAVTWIGRAAPAQTRFLAGENTSALFDYYLYRRLDQGLGARTRRVTGIVDVDDPACDPSSTIIDSPGSSGPCYGPLVQPEWYQGGTANQIPAVSADGWTIAFIVSSSARGQSQTGIAGDLFLTSMRPGVSRKAGTVELTREGLAGTGVADPIEGVALSPDGRWAAVTSFRRGFTFSALRPLGSARTDGAARELYLVDLQERTLERVARSASGGDTNGSAGVGAAISAAGRRIAFTSAASNLFFGDANGFIDAFYIEARDQPPAQPESPPPFESPESIDTSGSQPEPEQPEVLQLVAGARKARSGRIRLRIVAPVAGELSATVRGRLPGRTNRPSGPARVLAERTVTVEKPRTLVLELRLAKAFRARLESAGKITARAEVILDPGSGAAYQRLVTVQFRR